MKIELLLENKILLSAKYIKLKNGNGLDKILIKKIDIKSVDLQCGEAFTKNTIIRISFKNFENSYSFNISDILFKTDRIILMGVFKDPLGIYNQGYIDNFKLLSDKKEKIQWYELNNKQKYYYLRGCYLLKGLKEAIDNTNDTIIIDLSRVITDLDVYYEIGKAFFKSYGYFGTEINSFLDCLCNIDESLSRKEKLPTLKIKGSKNFKKHFYDHILLNTFYEEFNSRGFEIQNV